MAPPAGARKRISVAQQEPSSARKRVKEQDARSQPPEKVGPPQATASVTDNVLSTVSLQDRFIQLFSEPIFQQGISNSDLKEHFGSEYLQLVPIINNLNQMCRLTVQTTDDRHNNRSEPYYKLVTELVAQRLKDLEPNARLVYQVIESTGNMGCWTKDIRIQTNIQQNALNKVLKTLETRKLVKQCKSVNAKNKKLFMLYDLTPSKELTGGVWYSNDLTYDYEFISELRSFLLHCIRRMNSGQGLTLSEINNKMVEAQVSRVQLALNEVRQLVQTLVYDYLVEEVESPTGNSDNGKSETVYVAARRVTNNSEFRWWEALDSDFHFRAIQFEDGVILPPHEPHYHTA